MVAMLNFGQKIYLSILVMEVWTRTMAGITLVIIAPPHTQPTQKSEEKMNQNTKPNKVLIYGCGMNLVSTATLAIQQLSKLSKNPEHLLQKVDEKYICEFLNGITQSCK